MLTQLFELGTATDDRTLRTMVLGWVVGAVFSVNKVKENDLILPKTESIRLHCSLNKVWGPSRCEVFRTDLSGRDTGGIKFPIAIL